MVDGSTLSNESLIVDNPTQPSLPARVFCLHSSSTSTYSAPFWLHLTYTHSHGETHTQSSTMAITPSSIPSRFDLFVPHTHLLDDCDAFDDFILCT